MMTTTQIHPTPVKSILCLAGSLRRDSWNRRLLLAAVDCAPDGIELILFDGLANVPMFNEDDEQEVSAGVQQLRHAVAAADGLLIATPEYNHSFPGVLKNAIDWLSRSTESALVDKPVAVIGASTGSWGTRLAQAALRQVLTATEARVMTGPMLFVARASDNVGDAGQLCDPALTESLSSLVAHFEDWITLHTQSGRSMSHQATTAVA